MEEISRKYRKSGSQDETQTETQTSEPNTDTRTETTQSTTETIPEETTTPEPQNTSGIRYYTIEEVRRRPREIDRSKLESYLEPSVFF